MLAVMFKGILTSVTSLAVSYLPVIALNLFFDALDEAMETLLESAERKAALTPEKSDNRRLELYRKYWESFKEYRDRKK